MNNKPYLFQFICLSTLLLAVMVQGVFHWIPMKPLDGFADEPTPVEASFGTCYDGSYQKYLTDNAKQHTGFREFLIRNYNQVAYSCFDKITNNNIVKGKNDELYTTLYLNEVTGNRLKEFDLDVDSAKAQARENVEATLAFIDTLHRHGAEFLVIFAPSKTAVYPENLPKKYQKYLPYFSLEDYYIELYKEKGIPHIDFLTYFKNIKDKFPYPLYAKTGTHWSEATIPFVTDSIFRKIEELTGYRMPSINYIDPNISTDYSPIDGELEGNMNLLFPMRKPAIPNPVFSLCDTVGKDHINLLVVGDSYFNQIRRSCFVDAFNHWDLWVYCDIIQSSRPFYDGKHLSMVFDAGEVIEDADIVISIFTSAFLPRYMFDFIPYALEQLQAVRLSDEVAINQIIDNIKNNPEWLQAIEKQAENRGVTLEQNLRENAEYVLQNVKKSKQEQQP